MDVEAQIENAYKEMLSVTIEGNENSNANVVLVHGFGANKDEGANLFVDISNALRDRFRIFRFDFSGYGKSGGKQEEATCKKHAGDLKSVIRYVHSEFPGEIDIIAHSLGTYVVAMLSPEGISKTIFLNAPCSKSEALVKTLQKRITAKENGKLDENGSSVYPRSDGSVQIVGAKFWEILKNFDPLTAIEKYSQKSELMMVEGKQDDVINSDSVRDYRRLKKVRYETLSGNHNFSKLEDRSIMLATINSFLEKR